MIRPPAGRPPRVVAAPALLAILLVLTSLGLTAAVAPSARADDELGLSPDGRSWSGRLTEPLFDAGRRWVPGEQRTAHFEVRNQDDQRGYLEVRLARLTGARSLANDVTIETRVGSRRWQPVRRLDDPTAVGATPVPSGQTSRVEVRASFTPASRNDTQRARISFDLRVRLTQDHRDTADDGSARPAADRTGGLLPDTGSPITLTLVAVAAALIGCGIALAARRKETQHD